MILNFGASSSDLLVIRKGRWFVSAGGFCDSQDSGRKSGWRETWSSLGHIASHYCLGHNQLLLACLRLSNSLIKEVNSHHEMLVNEDLFSPACLIWNKVQHWKFEYEILYALPSRQPSPSSQQAQLRGPHPPFQRPGKYTVRRCEDIVYFRRPIPVRAK